MMKILLATSNKHKLLEIRQILQAFKSYAFDEILNPFKIEENGTNFKENALIKTKAVFNALDEKQKSEFIVLSDDSGICIDVLGGKPGIYSARFSEKGDDKSNRDKLVSEMAKQGFKESKAHFTTAIAIMSLYGEFVVCANMYGKVISEEKGENGFGYDALFIPKGFDKTLAELSSEEKNAISHRFEALQRARLILQILNKD